MIVAEDKISKILELLRELTVAELADLQEKLRNSGGIVLAQPVQWPEDSSTPPIFTLWIRSVENAKAGSGVTIIKMLRQYRSEGLMLGEARDIFDDWRASDGNQKRLWPLLVAAGISRETAGDLLNTLLGLGVDADAMSQNGNRLAVMTSSRSNATLGITI